MAINLLIAFYSRSGSTEALAKAVAEGAETQGAEVRLRRARELVDWDVVTSVPGWKESAERQNALYEAPTAADAEWADGIVFGAPTRFGRMPSAMGSFWEHGRRAARQGRRRFYVERDPARRQRDDAVLDHHKPLAFRPGDRRPPL